MNSKVASGENMGTWSEKHKSQQTENSVNAPSTLQTQTLKQTMINNTSAIFCNVEHSIDGLRKKRKKEKEDVAVPDIIYELKEDLDRELDIKAERNNLTATNVKNMIKAVITDSEVLKMIDYSLDKSTERPVYELKLTRAKTKELVGIDQNAILSMPCTQKNSYIKAFINQELLEDSSDEEYEPQDEGSDEESKANENIVDEESLIEDECSGSDSPVKDVVSIGSNGNNSNENIWQRTRSKLSLSETPLEEIEQAFIPPDITTDMYNTHCDNQDWLNFLKEIYFDSNQLENNDDENDPEYNVMVDEETEGTDIEELRVDRAVKITKKELNELMSELFEYTEMLSSDEEEEESKNNVLKSEGKIVSTDTVTLSTVPSKTTSSSLSTSLKLEQNQRSEIQEKKDICNKYHQFTVKQIFLLKQQLQQHVQLLLQSFLLSYKHPLLPDGYSLECKNRITELSVFKTRSSVSGSFWNILNLDCSIELINKWIKYLDDHENCASMKRFMEAELEKFNFYKKKKNVYLPELHPKLIELCLSSCAFMYPLYLPRGGFTSACSTSKGFTFHEKQLIAMGLEEFSGLLGLLPDKKLRKIVESISYNLVVTKSTSRIMAQIRALRKSPTENPIKEYFETNKAPKVQHYVVVQSSLKALSKYPVEQFPESWEKYLKK